MPVDDLVPTACDAIAIDRLRAAYPEAWARLRRIRGMSGLGIGLDAHVDGDAARAGWRVYVDDDELPRARARVPATVAGFATTVVPRSASHACYGGGREPTLKPGIEIRPYCKFTGSLGCFGHLTGTNKIVILGCAHVLYDGGANNTGRNVGQPSIWCCWWCRTRGVATNRAFSFHPVSVQVTHPAEDVGIHEGDEIDAAIATLNQTRPYANESEFYGKITGAPASGPGVVGGSTVEFVGSTSGHRKGMVLRWITQATYVNGGTGPIPDVQLPIAINGPGGAFGSSKPFVNHIWIIPEPSHDPEIPFIAPGDSGAAVVNSAKEVIGLVRMVVPVLPHRVFLRQHLADPLPSHVRQVGIVCPIGPILRELKIDLTPANLPGGTAPASDEALAIPEEELQREREEAIALEQTLNDLLAEVRMRPIGRDFLATLDRHLPEIRDLVNRKAEVTVAWHRSHGPGWAAHAMNSIRDHRYVIPRDIQGLTRADTVTRMAAVLRKHGSPALRAALDRDEALIRACITTDETGVWSVIERLRRTYEPDAALAGDAVTSR